MVWLEERKRILPKAIEYSVFLNVDMFVNPIQMKIHADFCRFTLLFACQFIVMAHLFSQENMVGTYAVYLQETATGAIVYVEKSGENYALTIKNAGYPDNVIDMEVSGQALIGYDATGVSYQLMNSQSQTLLHVGMVYSFRLEKKAVTKPDAPKAQTQSTQTKVNQSGPSASGQRYTDTQNGYGFNAPSGWVKQDDQGSGTFMFLKDNDNSNIIAIAPHHMSNITQVREQSTQAQQLGNLALSLSSQPQQFGENAILSAYSGSAQGQTLHLQAITMVSSNGGGLIVSAINVGATPSESLLAHIKAVAKSVSFSTPVVSDIVRQWKQAIAGKQLLYLKTANGMSDKWSYDLCSNGNFIYKSQTSYLSNSYSDAFTANLSNNETGIWKIVSKGQQAYLVLSFQDGSTSEFALSYEGEALYLNQRKYFIQPLKYCN
jgi:hypothetical protein